ncbi:MAG: Gmad2 immunoglobulin-like domain-containing protein [Anaerolineales bacterium]
MKFILKNCTLIFVLVSLTSCGIPAASATPTTTPVQEATPAPIAEISVDQLKNAQYQLGTRDDHALVQLTDGKYQQGTDATTQDYASIVLTDFVALGDLTGDGVNEAAAIVFENYGGTGNFAMLAIYSEENGSPVFLTSVLIDDRPVINGISIENGEVFLDATTHAFDDPFCCPTLATTRSLVLSNHQLWVVNYTTSTPDGKTREIGIDSPANQTEVSGSVHITGKVSVSPFENNLSYFIYDESWNELAKGPISVTAPDLGAAGSFDATIALDGISSGIPIYFEVQDISPADGSWLAMDAVKLTVK